MPAYITGGAKGAIIGSWRAHLNVLSRIVNENIQTALILEDDVDWDITLKSQLEEFARGALSLQKSVPSNHTHDSPYGSAWDTLWLGHCRITPSTATQEMYFIMNDTTVPPVPLRSSKWLQRRRPPETRDNNTRIVFNAAAAGCTFAYAVTWEAAQKIIASLSLLGEGIIYDVSMGHMCSGLHIAPFTCYGIFPPLLSSHRFAGRAMRDSDIRTKHNRLHGEQTFDVVYSVVMNIVRLLSGADNALSQWPEDTIPQRNLDESYADQVHSKTRFVNMVSLPEEVVEDLEQSDEDILKEIIANIEEAQ